MRTAPKFTNFVNLSFQNSALYAGDGAAVPSDSMSDSATPDATKDTTVEPVVTSGAPSEQAATDEPVSLLEASRVLGVSLRTVQRRIKAGDLETIERDGERMVILPLATVAATRPATTTRDAATAPQPVTTEQATTTGTATSDATEAARLREDLEREREQVKFLRGLVEAHQRSEAELRQTLREALRLSARALPEGHPEGRSEAGTERALQDSQSAQEPQAAQETTAAASDVQRAVDKPQRPFWKGFLRRR